MGDLKPKKNKKCENESAEKISLYEYSIFYNNYLGLQNK